MYHIYINIRFMECEDINVVGKLKWFNFNKKKDYINIFISFNNLNEGLQKLLTLNINTLCFNLQYAMLVQ